MITGCLKDWIIEFGKKRCTQLEAHLITGWDLFLQSWLGLFCYGSKPVQQQRQRSSSRFSSWGSSREQWRSNSNEHNSTMVAAEVAGLQQGRRRRRRRQQAARFRIRVFLFKLLNLFHNPAQIPCYKIVR